MRKIQISLTTLLLLFILLPGSVSASTAVTKAPVPTSAESAEIATLLTRLDEVKALDKSTMNSVEKKALRKEVKSIKSRLANLGGGVYISAGAIIIILLLLIILL